MPIDARFNLGGNPDSRPRPDTPGMRILILADWLGDTPADQPLGGRSLTRIDIDNFESVMNRLAPSVEVPDHGTLYFNEIDDFHPDSLCRQSPLLGRLLEIYRGLGDPARADELIRELGEREPATEAATSPDEPENSDFEQLIGGRTDHRTAPARSAGLKGLIQDLVAPHVVDTRGTEPYRQATAQSLAEGLRGLLHASRFQALEANWLGLWWLVTQLVDETIEIRLLQASREELTNDLAQAGSDLAQSRLYRQLSEGSADAPWSMMTCLYSFSATATDIQDLAALAVLANASGAPFLAGADLSLAGCSSPGKLNEPEGWQFPDPSLAEHWQALRESEPASWLSLSLPRLLMRRPWGENTEAIDSFDFEEYPDGPDQLLWGSPALGLTLALGLEFQLHEWNLDPARPVELHDLPTFSFDEDGEVRLQPATETALSDRTMQKLASLGLSPLLAHRNRPEVTVPGCIALSGTALFGPWGR